MVIHGIQKLTLVDYPGHPASILFSGNCNFRCPFCQNSSLVLYSDEEPVLDNDEIGMKIRADEEKVRNAVPVSNKALLARYADRIEILDIYYEDTEVVNARAMPELDPFRHPQYPDDLFVFFLAQDKHYEQMWVRCGKYLFDAELRCSPEHY